MTVRGVVLFPGSGSSADHPSLLALERTLGDELTGVTVRRRDFPYRLAGRKFPDKADVLVACVRADVADLARSIGCDVTEIVIGGRSMGGRMCTLAAAGFSGARNESEPTQPPLCVAGVMAISYPLHPPGKPDVLRVAHFPRLATPTLFVSGTRAEFATPDELTTWTAQIPGVVDHRWIDGARHDLRKRDDEVARLCAGWVAGLRH